MEKRGNIEGFEERLNAFIEEIKAEGLEYAIFVGDATKYKYRIDMDVSGLKSGREKIERIIAANEAIATRRN